MGSHKEKMINRYLFAVTITTLLSGCSFQGNDEAGKKNSAVEVEFNTLCDQITTLTQSDDFSSLSTEGRADKLDKMLTVSINTSSNAYIAWDAIRSGPPEERYNLMREAAASVGYPSWNCAALEKFGDTIGRL